MSAMVWQAYLRLYTSDRSLSIKFNQVVFPDFQQLTINLNLTFMLVFLPLSILLADMF